MNKTHKLNLLLFLLCIVTYTCKESSPSEPNDESSTLTFDFQPGRLRGQIWIVISDPETKAVLSTIEVTEEKKYSVEIPIKRYDYCFIEKYEAKYEWLTETNFYSDIYVYKNVSKKDYTFYNFNNSENIKYEIELNVSRPDFLHDGEMFYYNGLTLLSWKSTPSNKPMIYFPIHGSVSSNKLTSVISFYNSNSHEGLYGLLNYNNLKSDKVNSFTISLNNQMQYVNIITSKPVSSVSFGIYQDENVYPIDFSSWTYKEDLETNHHLFIPAELSKNSYQFYAGYYPLDNKMYYQISVRSTKLIQNVTVPNENLSAKVNSDNQSIENISHDSNFANCIIGSWYYGENNKHLSVVMYSEPETKTLYKPSIPSIIEEKLSFSVSSANVYGIQIAGFDVYKGYDEWFLGGNTSFDKTFYFESHDISNRNSSSRIKNEFSSSKESAGKIFEIIDELNKK